jgi:hypothetical protein
MPMEFVAVIFKPAISSFLQFSPLFRIPKAVTHQCVSRILIQAKHESARMAAWLNTRPLVGIVSRDDLKNNSMLLICPNFACLPAYSILL